MLRGNLGHSGTIVSLWHFCISCRPACWCNGQSGRSRKRIRQLHLGAGKSVHWMNTFLPNRSAISDPPTRNSRTRNSRRARSRLSNLKPRSRGNRSRLRATQLPDAVRDLSRFPSRALGFPLLGKCAKRFPRTRGDRPGTAKRYGRKLPFGASAAPAIMNGAKT